MIDAILVFLLVTNLMLLGSSRMGACVRLVALQGIGLGLLPLFAQESGVGARVLALAVGSAALKGGVFPWLLFRAMREADVRHEVEPYVGFTLSMLAGVAALVVSLGLGARLGPAAAGAPPLLIPVAFFSIFVGLFLIVSRRIAVTQVLGYLAFENGIYAFGVGLAVETPLLVELGVLLDVFVAVFVMGIALFHINREFDRIDADRMSQLRG